jgi:putative endonuclease
LFVFAPSAILALDPRASLAYALSREDDESGGGVRVVKPAVYILASKRNGTLYDLAARVSVHRQVLAESFTQRHGVHSLVHYKHLETMVEAIAREKKLKKLFRAQKLALIEANNPTWRDLTSDIMAWRD